MVLLVVLLVDWGGREGGKVRREGELEGQGVRLGEKGRMDGEGELVERESGEETNRGKDVDKIL